MMMGQAVTTGVKPQPGLPGLRPFRQSSSTQAVEHYEISRYGTLRSWAEELGLSDAVKILEATLREEKATDEALTKIAETVVNQEAQAAA